MGYGPWSFVTSAPASRAANVFLHSEPFTANTLFDKLTEALFSSTQLFDFFKYANGNLMFYVDIYFSMN